MSRPIEALSPTTEMLLTSAGPTSEASQERLLELGRSLNQLHGLTVLRISDGWVPFTQGDGVPATKRIEQRIESVAARLWSARYLGYVLTKATVETHNVGLLSSPEMNELLGRVDMIFIPGGNTYQVMRGLHSHKEAIRQAISQGKPYIGESAGTIVAGQTTVPASIEPADTYPDKTATNLDQALGLLNVDVATHAAGRPEGFAIPGLQSIVASSVLRGYESSPETMAQFTRQRAQEADIDTVVLNDAQSLSISGSLTTIL